MVILEIQGRACQVGNSVEGEGKGKQEAERQLWNPQDGKWCAKERGSIYLCISFKQKLFFYACLYSIARVLRAPLNDGCSLMKCKKYADFQWKYIIFGSKLIFF